MHIHFHYIFFLLIFFSCEKNGSEDNYEVKDPIGQNISSKRGVAFGFQFEDDIHILGQGASWSYNWGAAQASIFDNALQETPIDYCPMAWNGVNASAMREYVGRHPECEYLLAFNEPNLTDQANMTPAQAAAKWPEVKAIADELGLKIISPAMNYGTLAGYSNPTVWLDEFFQLVPISDIDGISVHCYMPNATAVKNYIDLFRKYGKPIWLTEFCAWDGLNQTSFKAEGQQEYMSDVLNYLESDPDIFRYAWFIPRGGGSENNFPYMFLLKSSSVSELTPLGKMYVQMSTMDKSIYYVEQQRIEAEHYSAISISEGIGKSGWVTGPKVRVTSETPNESLELYKFLPGQWVEYQIEADRSKKFDLEIRHASFIDSEIILEVDGKEISTNALPATGQDFIWTTSTLPLQLSKGKHTLRITSSDGMFCMNWLQFI